MRRFLCLLALHVGCASNDFTVSAEDSAAPEDGLEPDSLVVETTGAETGPSVDEACALSADGICKKYEQCINVTFKTVWGSMENCLERVATGCRRSLTTPGARITPSEQISCNRAAVAVSCSAFIDGAVPCTYTAGLLAVDDACTTDHQCGTRFCQYVPGTLCGKCAVPPVEGAPCLDRCANPRLACVNKVCKARATGGQPCDPTNAPCSPSLVCSAGRCVVPAGKGEKCDSTGASAPQCNVYPGLYCNAGVCAAFSYAETGGICGAAGGGYTLCTAAGFCRVPAGLPTGSCIAAAEEGAACNTTSGPYCVSNSACVAGTCRIHDASTCK